MDEGAAATFVRAVFATGLRHCTVRNKNRGAQGRAQHRERAERDYAVDTLHVVSGECVRWSSATASQLTTALLASVVPGRVMSSRRHDVAAIR